MTETTGVVTISIERFRELEALEVKVQEEVEKRARELNNAKLDALREKDTPENRRERSKRYYEKHKDEITKRKREMRAAMKGEVGVNSPGVTTRP